MIIVVVVADMEVGGHATNLSHRSSVPLFTCLSISLDQHFVLFYLQEVEAEEGMVEAVEEEGDMTIVVAPVGTEVGDTAAVGVGEEDLHMTTVVAVEATVVAAEDMIVVGINFIHTRQELPLFPYGNAWTHSVESFWLIH